MTDIRPEGAEADPEGAAPPGIAAKVDNVARNSAVMAIGTFGSRILGFVRAAMLTAAIGAGVAADSFTIANTLPTQLFVLINGGLISALLIPQLTKAMLRKDGGQDFSDRLITLCLLVLGVATLLSVAATPWIVQWLTKDNAGQAFINLTTFMAYICMPQLFFYGLYAVLGQVLQARGNFLAFAWAPAWANIIQIAGLGWFIWQWGKQPDVAPWTTEMILVLGISTTLGIIIQGLSLAVPLWRSGFRYRPRFGWRGYGFGDMSRMTGWTVAALLISQFYGFVSTAVMSPENADGPSVAGNAVSSYAYSLYILPHSIITTSIVTALFPAMSRAHESGDLAEMRRRVVSGLKSPAVLLLPAVAAFIALGRPIAKTLFWGTRYNPSRGIDEPGNIAFVLALMAIGLMPFGITALKQRYCFARGDGWMNFWLVAVMTVINLAACAVAAWMTPTKYIVAVIAAGASIANIVSAAAFLVVARRQLNGLGMGEVVRLWVRLAVASGVAGLAAWAASTLVFDPSSSLGRHALALLVGGAVLGLVFLVLAKVLRIREVDDVLAPILRRLPIPGAR
ncbi:murein biosynthesis integral membrane protein MurJ [Knoellia subterranea]|uniref:Membrane protein n=1 Tax=Knoellia subterranea KCTC 19937 TaxID=1385521 RepID=A0A0A0JKK2_9MICO|nr:murein biosynthesis integral membrane protein MurJ [Knoellia subterranea]KGN36572.1 membrane protein [Knoellia subterranea KCTC 19937]